MNKNHLTSIAFAISLLAGSVGYAQSDSAKACNILDSTTESGSAGSDSVHSINSPNSLEDENRIVPAHTPITSNSLSSLSTAPPAEYRTPDSIWSIGDAVAVEPVAALKSFTWESPNVIHRNLLFEEPLLERHGFQRGIFPQPVVSGAKFFWRSAFLPLDVIKKHHRRCDSGLGWEAPNINICNDCPR